MKIRTIMIPANLCHSAASLLNKHLLDKKLFTILILASLTFGAQAQRSRHNSQRIQAYPVVGFTASQIEGDELKGFKKIGFTGGVGALVSLNRSNLFKLSLEATFSQRGAFNDTGAPYNLKGLSLNYVDIPLMIHFQDPYGGMQFGVGLNYSRLVQQPHGTIEYNPTDFIPDTSNFLFLMNDVAFVGDIRFSIWNGLKLNLRYQYSLIPIKNDWKFTENKVSDNQETWTNDCYNSSISVRIMYVFGDNGNNSRSRYHRRRR